MRFGAVQNTRVPKTNKSVPRAGVAKKSSNLPSVEAIKRSSNLPSVEAIKRSSNLPSVEAIKRSSNLPSVEAIKRSSNLPSVEAIKRSSSLSKPIGPFLMRKASSEYVSSKSPQEKAVGQQYWGTNPKRKKKRKKKAGAKGSPTSRIHQPNETTSNSTITDTKNKSKISLKNPKPVDSKPISIDDMPEIPHTSTENVM